MGPIHKADSRQAVVRRMLDLLDQAKAQRCDLVVYPELAFTTFFPRWYMTEPAEVAAWFEREMPSAATRPLFEQAADGRIGLSFGYAELTAGGHHFNTSILVDRDGKIVGKCICNDRRWPETYRVMGLQGVELIVLGYNTPSVNSQKAEEGPEMRMFHHRLTLQAGAYQNSTWVVAVAKGGVEDGFPLIAGSIIVNPDGEIVAEAKTEDDELVVADCDLAGTIFGKETIFDFKGHRRVEHYGRITSQTGIVLPPQS